MDPFEYSEIDSSKEVLSLIKEGNNENVEPKAKLHYFAECGNKKVKQYLLNVNYDINAQDSTGATPLMLAVRRKLKIRNKVRIVKTLLAAGADIMTLDNKLKSILQVVCEEEHLFPNIGKLLFDELCKKFSTYEEVAQSLIDAGCHIYQACCFNNIKIIEYMLKHNLPINSTEPSYNLSALHVAVLEEDVDTVKLLLKNGANVNTLDKAGDTPLYYVYRNDRGHTSAKVELLRILLHLEDSPTLCNPQNHFQISPVLTYGNHEAIRVVLLSNLDFTAKETDTGWTALHYLALNTNPGIVEELKLFKNKYDANVVDELGTSPLHVAVREKNVDFVKFLLDQDARPNIAHIKYGYTPLYYAYDFYEPCFEKQCDQCVELLLQNGAEPQCIITNKRNKQVTIFDVAKETNSINRLKAVIAHLVKLEAAGVPITQITYTKINLQPKLKKYFNKCRKLINKEIYRSVTLLKLLTGDKKKLARYSGNKQLMLKLIRLSYKQNLKYFHSYYYNTLKKQLSEGISHRRFLDVVAGVICKIFEYRLDKTNLIVNNIIDFLCDESLQNLYQLSK